MVPVIYFTENAEIGYGCDFNLSKMLKKGAAGNLFHLKCINKVRLPTWSIGNSVIRYG